MNASRFTAALLVSCSLLGNVPTVAFAKQAAAPTMNERIAQRLQQRAYKGLLFPPSIKTLSVAVKQRQDLLRKPLTIIAGMPDTDEARTTTFSVGRYPLWIQAVIKSSGVTFTLNAKEMQKTFSSESFAAKPLPQSAELTSLYLQGEISRGHISGQALAGVTTNAAVAAEKVLSALQTGKTTVMLSYEHTNGSIVSSISGVPSEWKLLGSGRSNYRGSEWARVQNVKKAINEHVQSVIVPTGAEFSFNKTLSGAVSTGNGWHMAKVIKSLELEYAPGGGICQASTTLYRAILHAGLPILQHRSHSLFVTYYEKYGVGQDATVFPGSQDLTFRNDTAGPLLIQAYTTLDQDAVVEIYGQPDGRTVQVDGPFFKDHDFDRFAPLGKQLRGNEIGWIQKVQKTDGTTTEQAFIARYQSMPKRVVAQYALKMADQLVGMLP